MTGCVGGKGWRKFPVDTALLDWTRAARTFARAALADPALAHWYQCENTWFVGVDALPNDTHGKIGGRALGGAVTEALHPVPALHRAQLSVVWPGYPKPRDGEPPGAFAYRQNRDAAHVDGLIGEGTPKRRFLREPHAWILGLPLNAAPQDAAPLSVWEGSHLIMGAAFRRAYAGVPPEGLPDHDVTDAYIQARNEVFETCRRITVPAQPGEAILLHRHVLHGIAAWTAPPEGNRQIAYFRPCLPSAQAWLDLP